MNDGNRTAFAAVPIFFGNDRAMTAAVIELHCHFVRCMNLDAIDRSVDPAAVRIAHDHQRAGADIRATVMAVPYWRWKSPDIHGAAAHRVFVPSRFFDSRRRQRPKVLALLHPRFESVEWSESRIEPE